MPSGDDAFVPITGGTGYNVRTLKVTEWIEDPSTGIGAWQDVNMETLVLVDKRGKAVEIGGSLGTIQGELTTIRELLQLLVAQLG